ncbi:MAG: hypothetical protein ABR503_10345, partial [Chitinophagaceae bacterium]
MKINLKFAGMLVISVSAMFLLSSLQKITIDTKDILGAWGYGPADNRTVMINTDKVFSVATYDIPGKKFISSYGGTWHVDGNKLIKKIEWNSKDSVQVGKEISENVQIKNGKLTVQQTNTIWDRLDDGKPGELMGAWIITGSFRNDTV